MSAEPARITDRPVHLGLGASAVELPPFTGEMSWYDDYSERTAADGAEGRLVSMHTFTEPWEMWEVHPNGSELVLCTRGTITLHQELGDDTVRRTTLAAGEYVINPPGVWHTADVAEETTVLFVTAGLGTEHRPR